MPEELEELEASNGGGGSKRRCVDALHAETARWAQASRLLADNTVPRLKKIILWPAR